MHGEQTVQLPPVYSAKFLKFLVYKWTLEGFKVEKVVYVSRILGKGVKGEFMPTCTWTYSRKKVKGELYVYMKG